MSPPLLAPNPLLLIGGGAGSGKTTLARTLATHLPGAGLIHLDDCFHADTYSAPTVPRLDGPGRVIDFSDPRSLDPAKIDAALTLHADSALTIVEGTFALTLATSTSTSTSASTSTSTGPRPRWRVFVDTPPDIRVIRKTLRKLAEGRDPRPGLLAHAHSSRSHARYVEPTRTSPIWYSTASSPPAPSRRRSRPS
ncbi:hypothetical protein [Streptomyces sp. NPDC097619]|uniref:hypothetical protein n=1 Tax=Streptomyces sp. NPDC097619 TaxID=3157228 RepID=UPI00332C64A8